jgi:helix-turn-helix protein
MRRRRHVALATPPGLGAFLPSRPCSGPRRAALQWQAPCDDDRRGMRKVRGYDEGEAGTRPLSHGTTNEVRRLLSLDQAAQYLGLGSRWAVRRLVVSSALPVVKIAGKWRLDVEDLDGLISNLKGVEPKPATRGSSRRDDSHVRPPAFSSARLAALSPRDPRLVTER